MYELYQRRVTGVPVARVAPHERDERAQFQRGPDLVRLVPALTEEHIDGHDEGKVAPLEEVDGGETGFQAPGVDQYDRADRAAREFVPHEPEPVLARCAERVQHDCGGDGGAPEIQA